jgi:hypothetical protein
MKNGSGEDPLRNTTRGLEIERFLRILARARCHQVPGGNVERLEFAPALEISDFLAYESGSRPPGIARRWTGPGFAPGIFLEGAKHKQGIARQNAALL